jgi:polyphosphate glucokinase
VQILGIDVGGTGIKGAPVETDTGELLAERYRIPTPAEGKPRAVARAVGEVARHFDWHGPIGVGFPTTLRDNIVLMGCTNLHPSWVGMDAGALFAGATGCPVRVINDADAAGLAEMTFGAGKGRMGVVLLVTIGTGLGTALFTDGRLLPNTDLGTIEIDGMMAEVRAAGVVREREGLSWKQWAKRFDRYLNTMERLFWPDLIILGGGVAQGFEHFHKYLTVQAEVVPARLRNQAGIVGAALAGRR